MDPRPVKYYGDLSKKEVKFMENRKPSSELAHQRREGSSQYLAHQPLMTAITVQVPSLSSTSSVQIQTFVSTDPKSGTSTTAVVVGAHQERPRIFSRSRSVTPPAFPCAMKPAWSRYRSRSQTLTQRQASGSLPSDNSQPAPTGSRRAMRVSSLGLADDMKSLTLNEGEDIMDFTWG